VRTILPVFALAMWERDHGFPRFKKKMHSFVNSDVKQSAVESGKVKLPKIGWVKIEDVLFTT